MESIKKCKGPCGLEKNIKEFHVKKDSADGFYWCCRQCRSKLDKERNITNKIKISSRRKLFRLNNKEKIASVNKTYYENNKEALKEKKRTYYLENKDKIIKRVSAYFMKKRKCDPQVKIADNLRKRIRAVLKENRNGSAVRDLGCSVEFFRQYLEQKFYINPETKETMTWQNYGLHGWHIDHIIPLASFDLIDREQFLKACLYTNLQPLWAKENLRKSDKIIRGD